MPARHRVNDPRQLVTGTYWYYLTNKTQVRQRSNGTVDESYDVVGNFPNVNPLEIDHVTTKSAIIDGEMWNSSHTTMTRKCVSWPIDRVATAVDPRTHFPPLTTGEIQSLLRSLISSTSPNATETSIPTFVGELQEFKDLPLQFREYLQSLKEGGNLYRLFYETSKLRSKATRQLAMLPRLINSWGKLLLQAAASGHLSWRWIVKPMISDYRKMIQFQHHVLKRSVELDRIATSRGRKGRTSLGHEVYETPTTREIVNSSVGTVTYANVWTTFESRTWGSARWKLSSNPLPRTDVSVPNKAFRATFGINSFQALQTLWELTPWSWFYDWFTNVSEILTIANNFVGCYWENACVMRTLTSDRIVAIDQATMPSWATLSGRPVERWVRKERYNDLSLWLPTLPSGLPLLDKGRWSILASLAVLRFVKFRGLR